MKEIKISPYTILAILAEKETTIFSDFQSKINPLLHSHKITNSFFKEKVSNEELIKLMNYPASVEVILVCVKTTEEIDNLIKLSKEFQFGFSLLSFIKGVNEKYPFVTELEKNEKFFISYETDLSIKKEINDLKVCVVGDIHGCFETFKKMLLDDKGITIQNNKIVVIDEEKYVKHILVGDYIDKGSYTGIRKMIEFLYENLEHFEICIGNHEYWVAEYLKGKIKPSAHNTKLIGEWFTTVILLLQDNELKEKFFKIYNSSFHLVTTPFSIITHAPCKNIFLFKEDNISLKNMRNLKLPRSEEFPDYETFLKKRSEFFQFLKDDASQLRNYHIFGHTMIPEIFQHKNKICLDTGCVVGGKLSVALFNEDGDLFFKSYESVDATKLEILIPYFHECF